MKKTILLAGMMLAAVCTQAQLKVYENGNVSIGTSETPASAISVGYGGNASYNAAITGANSAIYGRRLGPTTTVVQSNPWTYGVTGINIPDSTFFYVGVKGSVNARNGYPEYGRAFGVFGEAGNATSGYNYGVYGQLNGTKDGAAIYGTLNPNYTIVSGGRYAGYFSGAVRVQGTLHATYLTTSVASVNNTSTQMVLNAEKTDETVTEKLSQLSAIQFRSNPLNERNSIHSNGDTLEIPTYTSTELQAMQKIHFGLMVTQLQQIYPNLVYESPNGELSINYIEMIPLLVESIKELKAEIATLQGGNGGGAVVMSRAIPGATDIEEVTALTIPMLKQNNPNPFTENTVIEYSLPETVQTANLYIYDMNGKQIEQIVLTERGEASVTVDGGQLAAGMYLYSLIADGKVIDTKRMILTK